MASRSLLWKSWVERKETEGLGRSEGRVSRGTYPVSLAKKIGGQLMKEMGGELVGFEDFRDD
jgi:hypothetical protein